MIIEQGMSCPLDLAFFLGWVLGIGFVLLGAWFVLFSYKNGVKKYHLNSDDASKKELLDILNNIESELDYLQKKCNLKYFRWRHNGIVDLIAYVRKRNVD